MIIGRSLHSPRVKVTTAAACALCSIFSSNSFVTTAFVASTPSSSPATNTFSTTLSTHTNLQNSHAILLPSTASTKKSSLVSQTKLRMSTFSTNSISSPTTKLTVAQIPCLDDNYGYLIHDPQTGHTAAVDTPDANAYETELKNRGWKLTHIFNTHHHWDHTGGNVELKQKNPGLKIYGPSSEDIPECDVPVSGGDEVTTFGPNSSIQIIDVGGHTNGHIAYYFPNDGLVFCGDALFALGCGKMFEGNPTQFWDSLKRLRALPDETVVYCAHEYTQSNAKFAMSVESGNSKLVTRVNDINAQRERGEATVPSLLGLEKETNPFLRVDVSEEIRNNVGATNNDSDDVVFGKVRKAKDTFRG